MKKKLSCVIAGIICFAVPLNASAANLPEQKNPSAQAHVYEVLPESEQWDSMTVVERLDACHVSKQEVVNMPTQALVDTVLNYPYLINIYAYNSLEEGIEMVSGHFAGLQELLSRDDCAQKLQAFLAGSIETKGINDTDAKKFMAQRLYNYAIETSIVSADSTRASIAYVYTPKNTRVQALYNRTWADAGVSEQEANAANQSMLSTYPSARLLRSANPAYNCHSYTWYSTSSSNKYWINDPAAYTTDGSYYASFSKSPNKITYTALSSDSIIHSGIVTSSGEQATVVTSKWGALGLFSHNSSDCPYDVDNYGSLSHKYWAAS